MSSAASDPEAVLTRLEAAVEHLAARAEALRAALEAAPANASPSRAEIAALADRLDATLARLRLAVEDAEE